MFGGMLSAGITANRPPKRSVLISPADACGEGSIRGWLAPLAPRKQFLAWCKQRVDSPYFAIVGFTQPACITPCDGRKLK